MKKWRTKMVGNVFEIEMAIEYGDCLEEKPIEAEPGYEEWAEQQIMTQAELIRPDTGVC